MKASPKALTHRLKVTAGQLHGVATMIEDNRSSAEVRDQFRAIQASLTQVQILLLTAELDGDLERAKLLQLALDHT